MTNIEFIDPQKAVNKYDPDEIRITDITKQYTQEEQLFKETYLNCGNATASFMKVYPEKCKGLGPEAIRARACNLVKKMMLKGKSAKRINSENKKFYQNSEPEMVEVLKKKYELGLLSEEELYSRMDELSKKSTSDQAKFNATKEMRQWVREAKSEIEANKLSALEIVPLMVDALTELPRLKYVEVLKGVRAKRLAKNSERGIVYNPDEIREKQRRDVMFRGAKRRGFEI